MKKLLISVLALSGFLFPLLAQIDHDFNQNDRVPLLNTTITREQVPAAVIKAAQTQFDLSNSGTWSKFPYALKEYGWVYDVGASDVKLDRYEVSMKNKQGNELWAVYTAKGELVESREASTNIAVPANVMQELLKSQYKDWKIVDDKEIIRFYHDHDTNSVEQHFRLTVEKDNVKRSISFNFQGATASM
ncbi:MAG: hypothetical protein ABR927_07460 [Bacteroidales bacterium]|jgi:hypothetical protein